MAIVTALIVVDKFYCSRVFIKSSNQNFLRVTKSVDNDICMQKEQ